MVWSQTRKYNDPGSHPEEQFATDALGNSASVYRRANGTQIFEVPAETRYAYQASTGRMLAYGTGDSTSSPTMIVTEEQQSAYDLAGNRGSGRRLADAVYNDTTGRLADVTVNYYSAGGTLAVTDRRTCIFIAGQCRQTYGPDFNDRQAFDEYRYDALGRRVLVRSRGEWGCSGDGCRKLIQRFVWDGDQLLYEISAPGGTGETTTTMERDVGNPPPHQGLFNSAGHFLTGRVGYTHGHGLDAPLNVIRWEYSDLFPDPTPLLPFTTWKGDYDSGTKPCTQVWGPDSTGSITDSILWTFCMDVDWPAPYKWVTELSRKRGNGPVSWMGSLIENKRDMTGQLYMRHRYYDPASGAFTQEDPIGLGGGLNLYGFANGDPVNFTDPFGLCPENLRVNGVCPGGLTVKEWDKVQQAYPHMTADVRRRTAVRLMRGQIHGGSLGRGESGQTDKVTGTDITVNRDYGLFGTSVFNDAKELPKTLIHEDQHVVDLENRPSYLTPGEAYIRAWEWYEKRAREAEVKKYVP